MLCYSTGIFSHVISQTEDVRPRSDERRRDAMKNLNDKYDTTPLPVSSLGRQVDGIKNDHLKSTWNHLTLLYERNSMVIESLAGVHIISEVIFQKLKVFIDLCVQTTMSVI